MLLYEAFDEALEDLRAPHSTGGALR